MFMTLATGCSSAMNVIIRHLTFSLHPVEIVFFRCLFGLLVLLPIFFRHGLTPLKTKRHGLHVVRAALQLGGMFSNSLALSFSTVAKVTAIKFSGPLFAVLLAVAFLGEKIRLRRIAATLFGFAGVLVIIRPGYVGLDMGAAMALSSAAAWAMIAIAIKILSRTESSITITLYMSILGTPVAFFFALPFWQNPDWIQLGWMLLLGGLGSLGHYCFAEAFRHGDVSIVSPFEFLKLIWVALLGYIALGELPVIWTWLGGAMIFFSTAYIGYRERTRKLDEGKDE